jgi:hypothetical protein
VALKKDRHIANIAAWPSTNGNASQPSRTGMSSEAHHAIESVALVP